MTTASDTQRREHHRPDNASDRENGAAEPKREPPHSVEAEQHVLGGIMLNATAWPEVRDILKADYLYRGDHRLIFAAIQSLAATNKPLDPDFVAERLRADGHLDDVGGNNYLRELVKDTAGTANIVAYATVIAERWRLRQLQTIGPAVERAIESGRSATDIVSQWIAPTVQAIPKEGPEPPKVIAPLDWPSLAQREPPPRTWWMQDWLSADPTLFSGPGGIGKSLVAQTIATSLAIGRDFLGVPVTPLRVLVWNCEDRADEIWRRQVSICRYFDVGLERLNNLIIVPRMGQDNTLYAGPYGQPTFTSTFETLREQVNDLCADAFIADNIAQIYGGNESARHEVTVFVNAIFGMVTDRAFCPILIGHTARAQGSEFSGSAAWENSCRMRWYMGTALPDQRPDDDQPQDDGLVYLCKRKANYTTKDYRRLRFQNGLLVPEVNFGTPFSAASSNQLAETIVLEAIPKLIETGIQPTDGRTSQDYLPAQILAKRLHGGFSKRELVSAMDRLMAAQRIRRQQVGTYANRSPKFGVVLV